MVYRHERVGVIRAEPISIEVATVPEMGIGLRVQAQTAVRLADG